MRYKHVGVKVVIDPYGDLIIDPSLVESLFKTKSNRKIRPHLGMHASLRVCVCFFARLLSRIRHFLF
jgi:hypothetical protein